MPQTHAHVDVQRSHVPRVLTSSAVPGVKALRDDQMGCFTYLSCCAADEETVDQPQLDVVGRADTVKQGQRFQRIEGMLAGVEGFVGRQVVLIHLGNVAVIQPRCQQVDQGAVGARIAPLPGGSFHRGAHVDNRPGRLALRRSLTPVNRLSQPGAAGDL